MEIKEIKSLTFGVASTEEIRNKSTHEVKIVSKVTKYNDSKVNTIYDQRGGALFNRKCATCKQYEQACPGHFGHIELNAPIIHPLFIQHVLNILKTVCHKCCKLLITEEHLNYNGLLKLRGEKKFVEIINKIKKFSSCFHCNEPKREYRLNKNKDCNTISYQVKTGGFVEMLVEDVKDILDDIDRETIKLLGICDPKNYCLEAIPVIPACCRPYEVVGVNFREDDLSRGSNDIVKANDAILAATVKERPTQQALLSLKFENICRNPSNMSKTGSEPIKGIRERLTGKDGQLRDNLMGKRTEMSARAVIGPDPHLKLDEVGIPLSMAKTLTKPIIVSEHNISAIAKLVDEDEVEKVTRDEKIIRIDVYKYKDIMQLIRIGDLLIRDGKKHILKTNKLMLKNGDKIFRDCVDITPNVIPTPIKFQLRFGDIAHRYLVDGDIILLNRQPTLWKGSMMSLKAKKKNINSINLNLGVCKAYNADFDGDEINVHVPQSLEAGVELSSLSAPRNCILNTSNGIPMIVIVQDALLGAYLMSSKNYRVSTAVYNDILMCLSKPVVTYIKRAGEIMNTLRELDPCTKRCMNDGKNLLSLLLPRTFNLQTEDITIINGVLVNGVLTKKYLGSSKSSIIFYLKTEYSDDICEDFINDIQFLTNKWLMSHSFSINLGDCESVIEPDSHVIDRTLNEAAFIEKTILNKNLAIAKANVALSNAKDIGIKLSQENKSNNFVETITAGSKGDPFNFGQIVGLVGQQLVNGRRLEKNIDNGKRTLIHYRRNSPLDKNEEFESTGFIRSNFRNGIKPTSFFHHAICGRQGVCDTSTTTYRSGYNMRKLVKHLEDIIIHNDGRVMEGNVIYDFAYGSLGLNPESKNFSISRIIDRINCCTEEEIYKLRLDLNI